MGFGVYHFEKGTTNANQIGKHIDREEGVKHTFEHSDGHSMNNIDVTPGEFQNLALQDAIDKRIEEGYTGTKAIRKDAVKYLTHIMTGSHEDMVELFKDQEKANDWISKNYEFLSNEFGEENIVKFVVHLDEKTPHIHAVTVPLKEGKLTAKEVTGNPISLSQRQDRYAKSMKDFGLERGVKATGVKHETSKQFYGRIGDIENSKKDVLEAFDKEFEKVKVGKIDIFSLDKKNDQIKAVLSDFVNKASNYTSKGEIARNTALKNEIKVLKSDNVYAKLAVTAENIKNKLPVLDYCVKMVNEGKLSFEGKRGVEYYFGKEGQKTGSISVNTSKNLFFDHQEGKGGDLFTAIRKFENVNSFPESVAFASENLGNFDRSITEKYKQSEKETTNEKAEKTVITAVFDDVKHPALKNYMAERNLEKSAFLKEVHWNVGEKQYFALGWKNKSDGFDVRNKAFKGKIGTNDITSGGVCPTPTEPKNKLLLFEGFTDYLSYRKDYPKQNFDFIVLNSTSNVEKAISHIKNHADKAISICFDNDDAGTKATQKIQEAFPRAKDRRDILTHDGFTANDYNAFSIWNNDEEPKLTKKENIKKETLTPKEFKQKFKGISGGIGGS